MDVEPSSGDRALKAGIRAREHYKDQLTVKLVTQTLKGIIEPESRRWFELGAELGDIIGGVVVGEVEHMSFTGDDGKARTIATVRRFDPVGPDMTVFSEIDQYYIGREDEEE